MPESEPHPPYIPPDLTLFGEEHVRRYRATDGEVGYEWNGATCLLLTTTGRKSGEPHTLPLIFSPHGDACVVVASHGGAPAHPSWVPQPPGRSERAGPGEGRPFPVTARAAEGEERSELWRLMTVNWPNYDVYTTRTDRVIPVVVLDRVRAWMPTNRRGESLSGFVSSSTSRAFSESRGTCDSVPRRRRHA